MEAGVAGIHDLVMLRDCVTAWQFKMKDFDPDTKGGRQLNADLARLSRQHGQDHLLLEVRPPRAADRPHRAQRRARAMLDCPSVRPRQVNFPTDYPTHPFALRLVTPRCVWRAP